MSKVYNSSVDFRVLSDEIKFVFYVSGRIKNKTFKKRKGFVLTYNTNAPVEVFVKIENNTKRVFLKFNQKYLKLDTYVDAIGMNKSDIILEVFIGTNGKHSFESVKGREYGAFLSHPNYYSVQNPKNATRGVGAMLPFENMVMGKFHALQMLKG